MLKVSPWYEEHIGRDRDTPEFQAERVIIDFTEDIVSHMQRRDISRAELARRLGVSRPFVTNLLEGSPNLTIKTIVRLAHAAGLLVNITTEPRRYHVMIERPPRPIAEGAGNANQYALAA